MKKIPIMSTPTSHGLMDEVFDTLKDSEVGAIKGMEIDLVMYGQSFGVYTDGKYERIPLEGVYRIEEEL